MALSLRDVFRFDKNSKIEQPAQREAPVYLGVPYSYANSGNLTRKSLGETVKQEPLVRKGIWKENRDIFKNSWTLKNTQKNQEIDPVLLKIINDFKKTKQLDSKLEETGRSCNIYGDGFLELIFDEPYTKDTISQPIPPTPLCDVNVINAEYITTMEQKKGVTYYIYQGMNNRALLEKRYIHPDRIIHITKKRLPGEIFGISDVYTGKDILSSKIIADKMYGEFIEWAGIGLFDVTHQGANNDDLKQIASNIKKEGRTNVRLHNEQETWTVINPSVFNPEPFNKYFFINIAALLDMPEYILTGVQPGQLTGSEIGFIDYQENIRALQNNVFTPVIARVLDLLLRNTRFNIMDYDVFWNPTFYDEQAEATIGKTRADTGALLYDRGVIDDDEYKAVMENGLLDNAGNTVFKKNTGTEQPGNPPAVKPDDQEASLFIGELSKYYDELARREREIGEQELVKQEERLGNKKTRV